jgi:hypothetical protein
MKTLLALGYDNSPITFFVLMGIYAIARLLGVSGDE